VRLSGGRRSDRARKRRPVKIVSFDTDDTGTNSSPTSTVVSPTARLSAVRNISDSAKPTTASCELDDNAEDVVKSLSNDAASSLRSKGSDVGGLPGTVAEPRFSQTVRKTFSAESGSVPASPDGLILPGHCASSINSDFNRHRTASLPDMVKDFSTESYSGRSQDANYVSSQIVNEINSSTSSTVKPDDFEGPQDLPSDNSWFGVYRDSGSNLKAADAESIGSNASTASSSSINNHLRFVSCCLCVF